MNLDIMFKKVIQELSNPKVLFLKLFIKLPFLISDKSFLKYKFRVLMHKKLDLKNPKTYSEKLQWLKLYDRKPEYSAMVDKAEAKRVVANLIGEQHIIPTLSVWEKFDDIDFDKLPDQFVLKTTHGCGGVIICKDKSKLDITAARKEINFSFKYNYFAYGREWPYKNVKPRIIAEQLMVDESGVELKDYKFFCFDGVPKAMFIATDRPHDTRFDFFDMYFNHLPFTNGHENATKTIQKPQNFELMIELASKLSNGIPHVRVDLYNINGNIYFGEMTFFHWGGMVPFVPEEWDYTFGSWISLPVLD
jgi:hypothetical protein